MDTQSRPPYVGTVPHAVLVTRARIRADELILLVKIPDMRDEAGNAGYIGEADPRFVHLVREAAAFAYSTAAGQPTHEVYVVLAAELKERGIYPDPPAVLEAAMLISRGKKPAVLRG